MSDSAASTDGVAQHVGNVDSLKLALGLCLCYTLCFASLRVYVRWRAYGADDLVVLLSTTLAIAFFGCSYASSGAGLGHPTEHLRNESRSTLDKLNSATLAANITWIISLCLSKAAVVTILMRTSQTPSHRRFQYAALGLVASQCIASIALITAACSVGDGLSWDFKSNARQCPKQGVRWQVITGLDVATEAILLFLPVHLTWNLQMSLKTKAIVVTAFWLRIPTIIFTVFRNTMTDDLTKTSDALADGALVVIWQAVELSYSLAAVTIAALKSFTENLNTGFGHGELVRVHGTSNAYKMSDLSTNMKNSRAKFPSTTVASTDTPRSGFHSAAKPSLDAANRDLKLRPESLQNLATISSPAQESAPYSFIGTRKGNGSIDTGGSEEHIIMQEIQYSVHYDQAPLYQRH